MHESALQSCRRLLLSGSSSNQLRPLVFQVIFIISILCSLWPWMGVSLVSVPRGQIWEGFAKFKDFSGQIRTTWVLGSLKVPFPTGSSSLLSKRPKKGAWPQQPGLKIWVRMALFCCQSQNQQALIMCPLHALIVVQGLKKLSVLFLKLKTYNKGCSYYLQKCHKLNDCEVNQ